MFEDSLSLSALVLRSRRGRVTLRGRSPVHQEVGQLGLNMKVFPHLLSVCPLQLEADQRYSSDR